MELPEPVVQPLYAGDRPGGLPQLRHRAAAVVPAGEVPHGPLDGGHEFLAVAQQVPPLEEGLLLPRLQLGLLQLLDLEGEAVHAPLLLRLVHLQGLQLLPGGLHGLVAGGVGLQLRLHPAEAVQVGAVLFLVQQLLPVVLAVDVQQRAADPAQLGHGHRPAAHAAGVLPVGVDLPLEQKLPVLRLQAALLQGRQGRHAGEHGADEGLRRAGADQVPAGPLAQHGPHGVDHDALSGAGLAGQGVEALVEGDVRLLDHRDILNMQQL